MKPSIQFLSIFAIAILTFSCKKEKFIKNIQPSSETVYTFDNTLADKNGYSDPVQYLISGVNCTYDPNGKVGSSINVFIGNGGIELGNELFSNIKKSDITEYTLSFWLKYIDVNNNTGSYFSIQETGGYYSNNGTPDLFSQTIGGNYYGDSISTYTLYDNNVTNLLNIFLNKKEWNNIIIINTNDEAKVYFNGTLVFHSGRQALNPGHISIGSGNANFSLDDIHIWNYAISEQKAIDYYNSTK